MATSPGLPQLRFAINERINKLGHKYRTDLILEKDGIAKRWAIQKGLPPEPTHPTPYPAFEISDLDLSKFLYEGPVFKENVGVGEVKKIDSGTYQLIHWYENNIEIILHGEKSEGTYVIFRTGKRKSKKDWLINKKAN